jgi:Ras GTPase-activating-like protein IQGAP2/3
LIAVADVPDAEIHFQAHEFLDATVQPKPIYISPNEVYSMHSLLANHVGILVRAHHRVHETIPTTQLTDS